MHQKGYRNFWSMRTVYRFRKWVHLHQRPGHAYASGRTYRHRDAVNRVVNKIEEDRFIQLDRHIERMMVQCTDEIYQQRKAEFDASAHPFIYTPGDNEWTDCRRAKRDSLERLARLRQIFFGDRFSMGRQKLELALQDLPSLTLDQRTLGQRKDVPSDYLRTPGRVPGNACPRRNSG